MINIENLTRKFIMGDNVINALNGIDLRIKKGEMVAITGSSGSGKSTLLNILGCLDSPDEGKYYLDSHEVASMSIDELATIRNKKIGFIFQTFNLLSRMTALENVELPLLYGGIKNTLDLSKKALERVGLGDRMDHEPNQLSGGQRQRVSIARAIVTNPAIILADEPTGNLDSKTSEEIMDIFKELHSEGRTLIIVTHEKEIADQCEREIILRDGKIIKE